MWSHNPLETRMFCHTCTWYWPIFFGPAYVPGGLLHGKDDVPWDDIPMFLYTLETFNMVENHTEGTNFSPQMNGTGDDFSETSSCAG
jgi:hypothetical protein